MKEIRFTLGDCDVWHSLYANIDVISEVQVETIVSKTIDEELEKIRDESIHQKKVSVRDETGKIIGESSDICEIGKFRFK